MTRKRYVKILMSYGASKRECEFITRKMNGDICYERSLFNIWFWTGIGYYHIRRYLPRQIREFRSALNEEKTIH